MNYKTFLKIQFNEYLEQEGYDEARAIELFQKDLKNGVILRLYNLLHNKSK